MNEFIVAGARLNSADNSVFNLNCHTYTRNGLTNWIDFMNNTEKVKGFPTSDDLINELQRKGIYRFTTPNFMFVIKRKDKSIKA